MLGVTFCGDLTIQLWFRLEQHWLDMQERVSEVLSVPEMANGGAAGVGRQEQSALCLPPLTFDYQLSSSFYGSPRYCSTFAVACSQIQCCMVIQP